MRELATPESRTSAVREAAARVIWALNGFGRMPEDFETWAGNIFKREEVQQRTEHIRRTW
jgi:hypothetical protein